MNPDIVENSTFFKELQRRRKGQETRHTTQAPTVNQPKQTVNEISPSRRANITKPALDMLREQLEIEKKRTLGFQHKVQWLQNELDKPSFAVITPEHEVSNLHKQWKNFTTANNLKDWEQILVKRESLSLPCVPEDLPKWA